MIKINGQELDVQHFPDGTQLLKQNFLASDDVSLTDCNEIEWNYENDEELVTLIFMVKHLKNVYPFSECELKMNYVPNARMDRTKNDDEVFTLKYFCEVINSLGFKKVTVLDPHSNVAPALLDHVEVKSPRSVIFDVVEHLGFTEKDYVYFPDEGACKRYADLFPFKKNVLIGHKVRDWKTGKIQGLNITDQEGCVYEYGFFSGAYSDSRVIMIDDIISYGGTLAYSADELKKLGFGHIYAYATHTENSVLDPEKGTLLKRLEDGTVDRIYTTDSIYSGSHPKIVAFVA